MKKENKNNLRSFRYSDRVAEILEGFDGDSMNAKFENLVLYCFDGLEDKKKEYERLDNLIVDCRKTWRELGDTLYVVGDMVKELNSIRRRIEELSKELGVVEKACYKE